MQSTKPLASFSRTLLLIAFGCASLLLSGCANVYHEPRFSAQTCEIRGEKHFESPDFRGEISPVRVDGTPVSMPPWKGGVFVVVPPGQHRIKVAFAGWIRSETWFGHVDNMADGEVMATFKPGRHYRIQPLTEGRKIFFSIIDAATGERVSEQVEGRLFYFSL